MRTEVVEYDMRLVLGPYAPVIHYVSRRNDR